MWHQYNFIKIKTLGPTWHDRDYLLAHAMFQILDDFITRERPDEIIDWDSDKEHRWARDKMDELINWWKNIYLKFDAYEGIKLDYNYDDMFISCKNSPDMFEMKPMSKEDNDKLDIVNRREQEIEDELNKKLTEILSIRKYLWT